MNTSSHHQSPDALELTDKLRFVVLTMPLLGVVGGFLRMLDVPSSISLGAIVPTFVALFVLTFFRRSDKVGRHEHAAHEHRPETHHRARAAG